MISSTKFAQRTQDMFCTENYYQIHLYSFLNDLFERCGCVIERQVSSFSPEQINGKNISFRTFLDNFDKAFFANESIKDKTLFEYGTEYYRFCDEGCITFSPTDVGKVPTVFTIKIYGKSQFVQKWHDHFESINRYVPVVNWAVSERYNIEVPIIIRDIHDTMYPFIEDGANKFIQEFLDSHANILLLIGPPGTGKTSLIRHIINQSKSEACVTYDAKIMSEDWFFGRFMSNDHERILVLEDADLFLQSRESGNELMHKFLNVGDGLVSSPDKKIIFSTNLESIANIDKALLREGRCFDIVTFRSLTYDESVAVCNAIGMEVPLDVKSYTLAELFNRRPIHTFKSRRLGF